VNLRVLKSKTLSIAAILTFVTGFGMFTSVFLTPVVAQRLLGFAPTETGLLLLPGAIIAILGLIVSGKLLQNGVPPIVIVASGFVCFIYFNWCMAGMDLDTSWGAISRSLIFRALGMAFLTVPLTSLAVSSLQAKDVPQGAALNNMMRQLGGSFGISIVNTYSARRLAAHRSDMISNITASDPATVGRLNSYTTYFQAKGGTLLEARQKAMGLIELNVVKQSTLLSYLDTYFLIGLLFALALPLLFFVIKRPQNTKPAIILSDH
jgi:DHA2 family multidrug resistance protein